MFFPVEFVVMNAMHSVMQAKIDELKSKNKGLEEMNMLLKDERDVLRNRLQAFEMASQTSAEIIKGLREELRSLKSVSSGSGSIPAQDSKENASSAKTDPYTLGYSSVGKCSNPFPINTVERLHWENGHVDRMKSMTVAVYNGDMPWMVRS